jgi:hypothetical protein
MVIVDISKKKSHKESQEKAIQISAPNPENSHPKRVINFIDEHDLFTIKQVYAQFKEMEINIPMELKNAFEEKIKNGFIKKENFLWNISLEEYDFIQDEIEKFSNRYTFEVKGLQENKHRKSLKNCIKYEELQLIPEPRNRFDKNAIKVKSPEGVIGYVPAIETLEVKKILDQKHKAYLKEASDLGGFFEATVILYY